MAIDIDEQRYKMRQITERVVSGLKDRSRYALNPGVFTQEFCDGKSWFEYRLWREQSLDSEIGKYEFPDQHPLFFLREQLAKPKKKRENIQSEIRQLNLNPNPALDMIETYKESLVELCKQGDYESQYGETARCDVSNLLLYNERITCVGLYVAESKLQKNPKFPLLTPKELRELLSSLTTEEIRDNIVDPVVEERVIHEAVNIAESYGLNKPEFIKKFFRKLIDSTVKAEIMYIQQQKKEIPLFLRYR